VALCATHAAHDLEARAKRRIRKCGGIASNERLYVQVSSGPESFALSVLLAGILSCRCDVSFVSTPADATAIVSTETLDSYACGFLQLICSGNVAEVLALRGKVLDPLAVIPRNEVVLYSRYHGWGGEDLTPFLSDPFAADVCALLGDFSVGHPSAAYALMRIRDALPKLYLERIDHAL
jgi:tRNA(Ile)-lysidine synthase TilS/MesJ